jgi:myo-inositol 2-dehydrogenase/D-chiro-inositol 1-dehydrogenase
MRLAVLGLGRIGSLHARTLAGIPVVDELLLYGHHVGPTTRLAAELDATVCGSVEEALDAADAAVIAATTDSHEQLIRAAIERGLPTFCEKPLTGDVESSVVLAGDIEASGVPFQLGFQRRMDPAYAEARRLVESGELGTLYLIYLAGHDPEPSSEDFIAQSGGLFRDFAVHDFDTLRYLTGSDVTEVYADGAVREFPVFSEYDDVDTAVGTLRTDSGVMAIMGLTRHDPLGHDVRTEVFGSRDSVSVGLGPRTPLRSLEPGVPPPAGPPWRIFLDRWDDAYRAELEAFTRVVSGDIPSPCTARDGVAALRVAEAMTISLREHRQVQLAEIA